MKELASIHSALFTVALSLALPGLAQTAPEPTQSDPYGKRLGTVHFAPSCSEAARAQAARGLALLHHMTYEGARAAFASAAESDPKCAMAYWGQAMSYIHPLWSDPPSQEEFEQGQSLVNMAKNRGQKTDWENAYIQVVEGYYVPGWSQDERENLTNFEMGWGILQDRFPDDPEAAAFYALAHLANADPSDKSYDRQKRAADIARDVFTLEPDHPGAHHYLIHAYDYPPLAEKAVDVARSYSEIAPEVPHALHMPSHIFTRLGLWQESIALNRRSADAALKQAQTTAVPFHYLHAIDYLVYAHLQRAEDDKAGQALEEVRKLAGREFEDHGASAYALAAVPARLVLERQKWKEAASLEARVPSDYPWDQRPAMEAITHFARALGAARSGDLQVAEQALESLSQLHSQVAGDVYWEKQLAIQELAAQAWLDYAQSNDQTEEQQRALNTMRKAAELEDSTEKHPTTPSEVLPTRELLGDMLLEVGRYEEARSAYLAALKRSPKRFNSVYGLGRAAELAGNSEEAARHYQQLVDISARDAERDRLEHARQFLANR